MNQVEELLKEARDSAGDTSWVGPLCRAVARELRVGDLTSIRTLRRRLAITNSRVEGASGKDSLAVGVLVALGEAVAAVDDDIQAAQERDAWMQANQSLKELVIDLLSENVLRPSQIVEKLGFDKYQVSRVLRDLRSRGIIEPAESMSSDDGRLRYYRISDQWRRVLETERESRMKRWMGNIGGLRNALMVAQSEAFVVVMSDEATGADVSRVVTIAKDAGGASVVVPKEDRKIVSVIGQGEQLVKSIAGLPEVDEVIPSPVVWPAKRQIGRRARVVAGRKPTT